jgi:hypothetical protein
VPLSLTPRNALSGHALRPTRCISKHGPEVTEADRVAWMGQFYDQVDPDRVLSEAERERRAKQARKAHMLKLSFMAARARRKKAGSP